MIKPFIFCLFVLSLVSCQKNADMEVAPVVETAASTQTTPLAGTWTWTKTVMGGRNSQNVAPVTPQSSGLTRSLTIDNEGRLTLKEGNQVFQVSYKLIKNADGRTFLVSDAIEGMVVLSADNRSLVLNNSYRDLSDMYFIK